jgi:hypothetical protein
MKTGMLTHAVNGRSTVEDGRGIARAITNIARAFTGSDTA